MVINMNEITLLIHLIYKEVGKKIYCCALKSEQTALELYCLHVPAVFMYKYWNNLFSFEQPMTYLLYFESSWVNIFLIADCVIFPCNYTFYEWMEL